MKPLFQTKLIALLMLLAILLLPTLIGCDKDDPKPDTVTTALAGDATEDDTQEPTPPTGEDTGVDTGVDTDENTGEDTGADTGTDTDAVTDAVTDAETTACVHTYGEWTVTAPATCIEAGEQARTCTACGATEQEPIEATGHTEVPDAAVAPTCTDTGLTEGKHCSVCEAVLVAQETVAALGHTETIDAAVAPTCTDSGLTEGKHCQVCGVIFVAQESIPALGHTEVMDNAVAPTCTETGRAEGSHCAVCQTVLTEQEIIPALGHTEVADPAAAPTCTETGLTEGSHCTVCQTVLAEQEIIPALGHTEVADPAVAPTCTETGLTNGTHCAVCSAILVAQEPVPALGHSVVIEPAVAPTCTETGLTEGQYCSACSAVLVARQVIKATGHIGIPDAAVAPTCTETGLTNGLHCHVCREVLIPQEIVPATGHTAVKDAAVPPTCTETGLTAGKHCSVCHAVLVPQTQVSATGHSFVDRQCTVCSTYDVSKGLTFTSVGNGACIVSGIGSCTDSYIIIPEVSPTGGTVIGIGDRAFANHPTLTDIRIPDTVVSIGSYAFENCKQLIIVILPQQVTEVQEGTFSGCSSLESVTIPDSVTSIGTGAFSSCEKLQNVELPENLESIGNNAFEDCRVLVIIILPERVTSVGSGAFSGCTSLETVKLPESLETIGSGAFEDCESLTTVTLPDNLILVGEGVFDGCKVLVYIYVVGDTIPEGLEEAIDRLLGELGDSIDPDAKIEIETGASGHHVFGPWETAKAPTCTKDGTAVHVCGLCGERETKSIPATGHTPVTDGEIAPTCTQTGLTVGSHCDTCGEILTRQNIIPARGHARIEIAGKQPTCTEPGLTISAYCEVCDETLANQEVIPATGHTEVIIPGMSPTKTETGLTEGVKCSVCGEILVPQEIIPALGGGSSESNPNANVWDGSIATGFAGGSGTQSDPYLISTGAQLAYLAQAINNNSNNRYYSKYYKLTNSIDLNGLEWTPIGNNRDIMSARRFSGHFDGNGYVVFNYRITQDNTADYAFGLFGAIDGGSIKNLGVTDFVIDLRNTGSAWNLSCAGGIFGIMYHDSRSSIDNCYASGQITLYSNRTHTYVGMLAGYAGGSNTMKNCYATGRAHVIASTTYLGGLIGVAPDSLRNCYAATTISAQNSANQGPLCSTEHSPSVVNCYYYSTQAQAGSRYGTPCTLAQLNSASFYTDTLGWDSSIWLLSNLDFENGKHPKLFNETIGGETEHTHTKEIIPGVEPTQTETGLTEGVKCSVCGEILVPQEIIPALGGGSSESNPNANVWDGSIATGFAGGSGTQSDPYLISTGAQLAYLASCVNAGNTYNGNYFKLVNDIDLNQLEWTPIGRGILASYASTSGCFSGHFDGNGCRIWNLRIHNTSTSFSGLFGVATGSISRVGLCNVTISTSISKESYAGSIAGYLYGGSISECFAENIDMQCKASIAAFSGGIVGLTDSGATVENCYASGKISGNGYTGGIFGAGYYAGKVTKCYYIGELFNSGSVSSGKIPTQIGGIGNPMESTNTGISHSFFVGTMSSAAYMGPISGDNRGYVENCYYMSSGNFNRRNGSSTAVANLQSQSWLSSTLGWDFGSVWAVEEGHEYPVLRAFDRKQSAHTHTEEIIPGVEPTCTQTGWTEGKKCSVCNEILVAQEMIDALGHFVETIPDVAPTCTENGWTGAIRCSVCGEILEQTVIPALGHCEEIIPGVEPTKTEEGLTEGVKCSVCGEILVDQEIIPALGGIEAYENSVLQAIQAPNGECVTIQGIVGPSLVNKTGFYLIDETGVIAVITDSTTLESLSLGNKILITGTKTVVTKDGNKCHGQTKIDLLDLLENDGGSHEYSTNSFITNKTFADIRALDALEDHTTGAYLVTATVNWVITKYYTTVELTDGTNTMQLYCSSGRQYAFLEAFSGQEVTLELSLCNWSSKAYYNGCVLAVYTDGGKIVNKLNFPEEHEHTFEVYPAVPPTCTESGLTEGKKCSACGEILIQQDVIPALGHVEEIIPGVEPTCTTEGMQDGIYCSRCEQVLQEQTVLPALGHNLVNCVCTLCGYEIRYSEGLSYVSNGDGTCYVSGIGSCTDTDVIIPSIYNGERVTSIGNRAFYRCIGLTSIEIPDSVTSIGNQAFENCTGLTSVVISDGVTSIGDQAFYYCTGLTFIEIPDSVTSIGGAVFYGCYHLTSIVIPDSVMSISGSMFYGCTDLTSVVIGNSVTSIGGYAFNGCAGLTSVVIGNSVTSIGDYAFYGCTGLASITFEGTTAQWNAITKRSFWRYSVPATQVICSDGTVSLN